MTRDKPQRRHIPSLRGLAKRASSAHLDSAVLAFPGACPLDGEESRHVARKVLTRRMTPARRTSSASALKTKGVATPVRSSSAHTVPTSLAASTSPSTASLAGLKDVEDESPSGGAEGDEAQGVCGSAGSVKTREDAVSILARPHGVHPSKSKHKPPPPTLSTHPLPAFSSALLTGSPTVRTPVDEFGVHNLARSHSAGASAPGEAGYGAVGFLPSTLPADPHAPWASSPSAPPLGLSSSTSSSNSHKDPHQLFGGPIQPRAAYGLLSPARDAVLGLADAARLVGTVCAELERTGVTTPFVFSALALDWLEEARFAGPHELGMCLRWGLSRVVRVEGGREVRVCWAWYERWRVGDGGE
ncbi:hypothetical protein B0H13DRAFT_2669184 [Mycena leptocephala]|nr:hypothetical protein B0H13DRAFT_2669184 [Mycena leptocephala]